jgi:hypothetical protein
MSNAYPAHVSMAPPLGAVASFWLTVVGGTASIGLFQIQATAGSVVDVHVTGIMNDTQSALTYLTTAGPSQGVTWYPPLDGAADRYPPVALQTYT